MYGGTGGAYSADKKFKIMVSMVKFRPSMNVREAAVKAWVAVWYIAYVIIRVLLRLLIGRHRKDYVKDLLDLHYGSAYSVKYRTLRHYEPAVSRVVRNVLSDSRTFIDVGAFIGHFTLYAYRILRKKGVFTIVAVEPDPANYEVLKDRIKYIRGVTLVDEAVLTEDGEEVEFSAGKRVHGLSTAGSVSPTYHAERGLLSGEKIRVKTVRLDTLIKRFGLAKVDLVKMVIEGAEYPILTDPSIDLSRVENMVVEVHYRYRSRESREIMAALARHGFKIVPLYPDQDSNRYHLLACRGEVPW